MAQTHITLAECIFYADGRSCWTKLHSHDSNDRKRMESIQRAIRAIRAQTRKIEELAERTGNAELKALLTEQFPFEDHDEKVQK